MVGQVRLWAKTPRSQRAMLFPEAQTYGALQMRAKAPPRTGDLGAALGTFDNLITDPGRIDETVLITACEDVQAWAAACGLAETRIHFAEAAALIAPDVSEIAEAAARACRDAGQRRRAELWEDCAVGISREALGIELWRAVANVRLWSDTPESHRSDLFIRARNTDEAARRQTDAILQAPELSLALNTFTALIRDPGVIEARTLVRACQEVAGWAEQRGLAETRVQFTEAAAAAIPDDPELANLAGRACREAGKRGRAELWYDRAIALSRHVQGKRGIRENIHAHLGFATTLLEIEEYGKALRHIKSAGATAKEKGMKAKAAEAFHEAMYHASMIGELNRAALLARRAIRMYPYHHVRYPALAHDVAVLMIFFGMYTRALSVLQSTIKKITSSADQTVVLSSLARAAAGAGRPSRFMEAVEQINTMAPSFGQAGAVALYNVAEGARLLGLWDMAEDYAVRAEAQARATGAGQIETRARKLLTEVSHQLPGAPELPATDPRGLILRRLAPALRLRVAKWRGPTWRPRHVRPDPVASSC